MEEPRAGVVEVLLLRKVPGAPQRFPSLLDQLVEAGVIDVPEVEDEKCVEGVVGGFEPSVNLATEPSVNLATGLRGHGLSVCSKGR